MTKNKSEPIVKVKNIRGATGTPTTTAPALLIKLRHCWV